MTTPISDFLDQERKRIVRWLEERNMTLAEASRAIGRNHAYLQQYVRRGVPHRLPVKAVKQLAEILDVEESALRNPDDAGVMHRRAATPDRKACRSGAERLRSFAARLAIVRAGSQHRTPTRFANAAGIDAERYILLEDGADDPTLDELSRIAAALACSLDWLVLGHDGAATTGSRKVTGKRQTSDAAAPCPPPGR